MRWFGLSKIDVAMGLAFQKGAVPLSREALRRAIELNGVAVGLNQSAFEWGVWLRSIRHALRRWRFRRSRWCCRCPSRSMH